jgi:MurNAc alpha-1-phosphate uridylyltransferase
LGVRILWSRESEPLETAGGIIHALPLLGDAPFAVVNADVWTDYPFANLQQALAAAMQAHLILVPNPEHHPAGDFVLQNSGKLLQRSADSEQTHTFSGIAVYHPDLFLGVTARKYPLLPLLEKAITQNCASAELFSGTWMDIGTPQRLQQLDLSLQAANKSGASNG